MLLKNNMKNNYLNKINGCSKLFFLYDRNHKDMLIKLFNFKRDK